MRRKCISMLLAIVMALSLLPGTALAEAEGPMVYPVTGGNIYIHLSEGYPSGYFIGGCDKDVTEVVIPSEVDGHTLAGIDFDAFSDCTSLTSVTIPANILFIFDNPFSGCVNLTKIVVAEDNPIFSAKDGIIYREDKEDVVEILGYPSATGVCHIPEGVTKLGARSFAHCKDLSGLVFPDSLTTINYAAFEDCKGLTNVTLPDSLTSLGRYAFSGCAELTSIVIPSSVTTIDEGIFIGCEKLKNIDISKENPNYMSENGTLFSKDKTNLISCPQASDTYTVPEGVTKIGDLAFGQCASLTSIFLPASLATIGESAFYSCDALTDVYYAGTESHWSEVKINASNNGDLVAATIHYNSTGPDAADTPSTPDTPSTTAPSFTDVKPSAYYAAPVAWAVEQEITSGTGNSQFSPGRTCNVSEILTFLWRAAGKPEPTVENPFTDVKESNFYYKPALWAYEKGMATGSTFNPSAVCTRAMAVTFIWQASDSPAADPASFTDVPADSSYAAAVAWAVANGVTEGVGNGQFNPTGTCTRGQIVTFLYRAFAE